MRTAAAPSLVFTLALLSSCSTARSDRAANASRIVGAWAVRYTAGDRPDTLTGTMVLTPNTTGVGPFDGIGVPGAIGTYDVAFTRWEFEPRGSRPPTALARVSEGDSVIIRLDTDRIEGGLEMRGLVTGDAVRGRWSIVLSRGLSRSGEFTMTRAQRP